MKIVKSDKWFYLRGQVGPGNKQVLIDTPVEGKPRMFFVPENEVEKSFMGLDATLGITFIPYGPTSLNPEEPWGYRFYDNKTEEDLKKFEQFIVEYMNKANESYDKFLKQEKEYQDVFAAPQQKTDKKILN